MKYILSFFLLTICTLSYAQPENKTISWDIKSEKTGHNEYSIHFIATVQDGWYIYSQFLESDDGPVRTTISFDKNEVVTIDGKTSEEGHKIEGFDKLFEMNIVKFKKEVKFIQKIKTTGPTTFKGYITFMTCNDEQCLPPSDIRFELPLK